jgi:hypothetical protein
MEEVIVHLGRSGLRRALFAADCGCVSRTNRDLLALWQRGRLTAELSEALACRYPDITPARAYLAGLLHEMGRLSATLGWQADNVDLSDPLAVGRRMAQEWCLPEFVEATLLFARDREPAWYHLHRVVRSAWDVANAVAQGGAPLPHFASSRQRFAPLVSIPLERGLPTETAASMRSRPLILL